MFTAWFCEQKETVFGSVKAIHGFSLELEMKDTKEKRVIELTPDWNKVLRKIPYYYGVTAKYFLAKTAVKIPFYRLFCRELFSMCMDNVFVLKKVVTQICVKFFFVSGLKNDGWSRFEVLKNVRELTFSFDTLSHS